MAPKINYRFLYVFFYLKKMKRFIVVIFLNLRITEAATTVLTVPHSSYMPHDDLMVMRWSDKARGGPEKKAEKIWEIINITVITCFNSRQCDCSLKRQLLTSGRMEDKRMNSISASRQRRCLQYLFV